MTQEQFDYLNGLRKRLREDLDMDMTALRGRAELVAWLRDSRYEDDAKRVSELPDYHVSGWKDGTIEVQGMSGVIGWLWPDGSCRRHGGLVASEAARSAGQK